MTKNLLTLLVLLTTFALNAENKLTLKTNGTSTYTYTNESDISFQESKAINQKQTIKYTIALNQIDGKNNCILKFSNIKCEKKKKDSITVLDTDKPRLPLSYIIKRATNKDFKAILSSKALTNDSVTGIDSLNAHLFDDFAKLPDSINIIAYKHLIKEDYANNLVRSLIENSISVTPDSSVKEKGTWSKQTNRYGTFVGNAPTTYVLKEKKGNTYLISGINQIDKTKPCRYSIAGIAYLLEDVEGQIISDIIIEAETGLVKSSTTTIKAKAKATPLSFSETTEESITDNIALSIKQTIIKD